jgi:protein-S-isoprenylcysteine O-methyltransferase Ste14
VSALVVLNRGFPKGELFTGGPYALCRHPIYGSWCALIVPGIVLLVNRWPGFVVVALMWGALRLLCRREEAWLLRTFGETYRVYLARTPAVWPRPWRWRTR